MVGGQRLLPAVPQKRVPQSNVLDPLQGYEAGLIKTATIQSSQGSHEVCKSTNDDQRPISRWKCLLVSVCLSSHLSGIGFIRFQS